jgi:5'-nucleotidase
MPKEFVLITNDDGFNAPGILAVIETLKDDYELLIVAPNSDFSGYARSIPREFRDPEIIEHKYLGEIDGYKLAATPALCVLYGVKEILKPGDKIVACVSGVNNGLNVGHWSTYSATLGAALEGAVRGIPSIAVSCEFQQESVEHFLPAAKVAKKYLEKILDPECENPPLWNINCPELMTQQSVEKETWISKSDLKEFVWKRAENLEPGSDAHTVWEENNISITPMTGYLEALIE